MFLFCDHSCSEGLQFQDEREVIVAFKAEEVLPALRRVEERAARRQEYAAGFLAYEAAPAFDPALQAHSGGDFPLLWFGFYSAPRPVSLAALNLGTYALGEWAPSLVPEEYARAIAQIKACIARGETYQVNYTFRLRAPFRGDALALFLDLLAAQPSDYAVFADTGRFVLCSASPELFFRFDGRQITCRPMKGTAPRGRTLNEDQKQAEWLQHSEKNRAENVMVVDMVRNDLGRVAVTGSIRVPALFEVERYPTLWQMTSTVSAETDAPLSKIMEALFPCASVTGAPKVRTMAIIKELESEPRQIYTGCIGWIAPDRKAQFNVAIRTVLVDREREQAEYGVGGGVVWDSSADGEYAECQTKARLLTHRPPAFQLMEAILWTPEEGFFLLPYHLKRLGESAAYFGFPVDLAEVETCLKKVAVSLPPEAHKINLYLASDGYLTHRTSPLASIPKPDPAYVRLSPIPVASSDVFLYHKTTHRQVYEAARRRCSGCDDVLLQNERGELTEAETSNVVVELNGRLYTPPVECGLLPGAFRAWLLEQGQVSERVILISEIRKCDKIYLVNSIRKWREAVLLSDEE